MQINVISILIFLQKYKNQVCIVHICVFAGVHARHIDMVPHKIIADLLRML